jgi:phosphopantothenate synthetase
MAEALVAALSTAPVPVPVRSLIVSDKPVVTVPCNMAALNPSTYARGTIVFSATKGGNFAKALDAGVPAETDFIYVLREDYRIDEAVAAGDDFYGIAEGELNRGLVRAANAGLSDANFLIVEEILAKRGLHLVNLSYGDQYTP